MNSKETNRPTIFAASNLWPLDFRNDANSNSAVLYGNCGCVMVVIVVIELSGIREDRGRAHAASSSGLLPTVAIRHLRNSVGLLMTLWLRPLHKFDCG
jgi:hypothetical protein